MAQPGAPSCPSFDGVTDTIAVRVGERFTIGLESNRTTGYGWQLDASDQAGSFRGVGPTYVPVPPPQPGGPPLLGSGGQECFGLEATTSGTFTLSFSYRRPFEPASVPPARTKQITVIVAPASAPVQLPRAGVPSDADSLD
jgi:predicted secreted protein